MTQTRVRVLSPEQAASGYAPLRSALQAQQWRFTNGAPDATATPAAFSPLSAWPAKPIVVDPARRYQRMIGFGAALTESSAYLLMRKMTREQRYTLLQEMYGPGGFSMVRIGIGGSDFNVGPWYSNDATVEAVLTSSVSAGDTTILTDLPFGANQELRIDKNGTSELVTTTAASTGTASPYSTTVTAIVGPHAAQRLVTSTDRTLSSFNLDRENSLLIPLLLEILAINPGIRIEGSVWTPPSWMRTTKDFGNNGTLFDDARANFASFLVKWVQGMQSSSVPIYAITFQNEPWAAGASFIVWSATNYATFLTNFLGPALDTAGLTTKVMVHDHHWAFYQNVLDTLTANSGAAVPYVGGIGWHGYGGSPTQQSLVRRQYPSIEHHFTEMRCLIADDYSTSVGIMAGDVAIGSLRNWAQSITLWNLALDENGLPTWYTNGRRGLVTIPSNGSGQVVRNVEYQLFKRLAALVQPGAQRIESSNYSVGKTGTDLQSVAFLNPDESIAVMAYNPSGSAIATTIADVRTGQGFPVTIAAGEVSFFAWGTTAVRRAVDATPPTYSVGTTTPSVASRSQFQNAGQSSKFDTFSLTLGAVTNGCLLVAVETQSGNHGASQPQTVTWGGVPMKLIEVSDTWYDASGTQRVVALFLLVNPTPATGNLQVRLTTEAPYNVQTVLLQNVHQTKPHGVPQNSHGTTIATRTVTVQDVAANDLVFSAVAARTNSVPTTTANQTVLGFNNTGNSWLAVATDTAGTAGGRTQSYTLPSADALGILAVAIRGA